MKVKFVELEIPALRAVVPSLKALPAKKVLPLLTLNNDSARQFVFATDLLRSNIAEDLLDKFDSLDLDEAIAFVTQWIDKSNEGENNE
jgi:hypothetical protein